MRYDDAYWSTRGRQIGRELATIDRLTGRRRDPAALGPVPNAAAAWLDGRARGYAEGLAGTASPLEPLP